MEANEDGIIEDRDANTEEEEQPQVRDSEESRPIVSASSSAINEANVSSSLRNSETGQIINADAETNPEIPRSYQTINPQQQFTIPNLGSSSSSSVLNNFRQLQLSSNGSSETGEIQSVDEEEDHNDGDDEHETESEEETSSLITQPPYQDPFDEMMNRQHQLSPNAAPWRPQNTSQQFPVANQIPNLPPVPNQMIIRGPVYYAPWRLQNTYQHLPVANQIPNLAPVPNQMIIRGPVYYAPWRLHYTYQQLPVANQIPNLVPVPNQMIVPGPVFVYPKIPNYAPWRLQNTYQQHPVITPVFQHPMANLQNPYQYPMANMMVQRFRSDQMFRMIPPRGQPRPLARVQNNFNPQQHFVLPELNHQQLQQLQPQMQQPTQSQGFDAGTSSVQGQSQQQPRSNDS